MERNDQKAAAHLQPKLTRLTYNVGLSLALLLCSKTSKKCWRQVRT